MNQASHIISSASRQKGLSISHLSIQLDPFALKLTNYIRSDSSTKNNYLLPQALIASPVQIHHFSRLIGQFIYPGPFSYLPIFL